MYPKLKINVYFIFLNIGDLTFGITLVEGERDVEKHNSRRRSHIRDQNRLMPNHWSKRG
jgi:hypothetical protein